MTFRISLFVLTALCLFSSSAMGQALHPDKTWVLRYETDLIKFISADSEYATATPGRHPHWVRWLLNRFLSWQPLDINSSPKGDCELFKLQETIRNAADTDQRTGIVEEYYSKCKSLFTEGPQNPLQQALKTFSMKYDVDQNAFLHRVLFQLPDGQKLKGVLALKDTKRRPLVIVRAGITGNVEEAFAERFFFYQLFERGLFHVLLVENMTGSDYIHFNKTLNFGGLAESYQNIWLAQTLREPSQPLSQLVQSVHLIGLSLGGQGVLTSAWLARYQKNKKLFSSYLALCPLVDTADTFHHLFQQSWLRFPLEIWARSRFSGLESIQPELFKGFMGFPSRMLSVVAENYKRPSATALGIVEPEFIQKQNDFFALHQLSNWDQAARDPVWIWISQNDSIVPPNLNTEKLQLTKPLRIQEGNHCSFPVVWDNRVLSHILEGHILGSSALEPMEKTIELPLDPRLPWELSNIYFQDGQPDIEVELTTGDRNKHQFLIRKSDLDFAFQAPGYSEHERFMIRRWLSSNLRWRAKGTGLSLLVSWPMVK